MATANIIKNMADLEKLPNKDRVIEVVERYKNGRIKAITKHLIDNGESKELKEKAKELLRNIDKVSAQVEKSGAQLNKIASLETFNAILNSANLCATAVGFAIMNEKLSKITSQIDDVVEMQKKISDKESNYKFKSAVMNYRTLLDHKKTKRTITEDEYEANLKEECNVLEYLCKGLMDKSTADEMNMIYAIITLESMITCNIASLDELYYFSNKDVIDSDRVWPENQDEWEKTYDLLLDDKFTEVLQDYSFLSKGLSQYNSDLFVMSIREKILEMKQAIDDRKIIIRLSDSKENYESVMSQIDNEANEYINQYLVATA